MRTRRKSIARTAFTMASAKQVTSSPRLGLARPSVVEGAAQRNASHPTREGLSPTIAPSLALRVVSRLKLVHGLAP